MQYSLRNLALLASAGLVAALPQGTTEDCFTSTICTDSYPTTSTIVTNLITQTSVSSHFTPVVITTSTPSPVVYPVYTTSSTETTSTWVVNTTIRVPYTTSRVITVPVHTHSFEVSPITSTTELYPTTVITSNATSTTFVQNLITTSSACSETFYPVSTSLRTDFITSTVEQCYTVTGGHGTTSTLTTSIPTTTSILTGVTLSTPTTTSLLTGVTLSSPTSTTSVA